MVESDKILEAIKERDEWARREEEILSDIKELRAKKKELVKEAKDLKSMIESYKDKVRTDHKDTMEIDMMGAGDSMG